MEPHQANHHPWHCTHLGFAKNPERPLAFVGYGLGGLIIKRALILFLHPAMQPYGQDALDVVAGVVFFGTPHPKTKQPEQWFRLTLLLNLAGKLPKRFIAQSESDAGTAAAMCDDFEQSGLEAVVLSIYEEKPTRVKSGLLWLKDSVTIVDRAFAETWVKKEKLLGQDAGHEGISDVNPRSVIQQEIGLLLMSALSMRRGRMTAGALQGRSIEASESTGDSSYINGRKE
ncbi:hypothetical protein F4859DRAFT_468128 [Xylaria cf. heliscus]|nr:hypothetical protein F4859DRAFT_468128 [Xylaria cf. heliscus]